jgi:ABC-type antimicrobial peptide transport system permease subunit
MVTLERRREMAIRIALGALPRRARRLVVGQVLRPVIGGALLGSILAVGGGVLLRGTIPVDLELVPWSIAAAVVVALTVGACAALTATGGISRIPPGEIFRAE